MLRRRLCHEIEGTFRVDDALERIGGDSHVVCGRLDGEVDSAVDGGSADELHAGVRS